MSKARDLADLAKNANDRLDDVATSDGALSNRNVVINGNFDVWQRGTSQTSGGYGSDDRWSNANFGSTKVASQQTFTLGQTDVTGNPKYYSRTVVTSVAGGPNYVLKRQNIEGVTTFSGETATLTFWAKADANKNIAVEFYQDFGTGGSPSGLVFLPAQTVSLTSGWVKHSLTFDIPSVSGKTLGTGGNDSLGFHFWFEAGSDYNSRTNNLGQQSGTFDIAQVQLEVGDTATPFEHRSYGQELALCQRFYQRVYVASISGVVYTPNGDTRHVDISFSQMRGTPSVTPATYTNHSINFSEDGTGVNTPSITYNVIARGGEDKAGQLGFSYSSGDLSSFGGTAHVAAFGMRVFATFSLDAEL